MKNTEHPWLPTIKYKRKLKAKKVHPIGISTVAKESGISAGLTSLLTSDLNSVKKTNLSISQIEKQSQIDEGSFRFKSADSIHL